MLAVESRCAGGRAPSKMLGPSAPYENVAIPATNAPVKSTSGIAATRTVGFIEQDLANASAQRPARLILNLSLDHKLRQTPQPFGSRAERLQDVQRGV